MKRWLGFGVAFALVALIGYRLLQQLPDSEAAPAMNPGAMARPVRGATVSTGPVSESVVLVGPLRAEERVEVTPRVNGRLVAVEVDLGDAVRAGQLVARLDDDELQQQVQQSQASLRVSQAVVEQRELELQNFESILARTRDLFETELISSQELDQAQTRTDVARSQLNLARAQLLQTEASARELQIRLEQTRVLSPIDGLVGRRYVDPGAMLNSNTPIVTLIKIDTVELVANVPERDLPKVSVGATGNVIVDAIPGTSFTGTVARISPLLDPQTRTAEVEIVIPNENLALKAEMFARVELELASRRDAIRVARDALVVRGTQAGVYVVQDGQAMFRGITTGIGQDDWVEVVDGLAVGETVVTLGANLLKDGDPVRVSRSETDEGTS